jgi:hypothetical protein
VRQPSLLCGGIVLAHPAWIAPWRTLAPDHIPEVIRNFPIRQSVLWVG